MSNDHVSLVAKKRQQQERVEQAIGYSDIEWNRFLAQFKEPEIRALEKIYLPQPKTLIYQHIYQAFQQINYSERSARRIINKLAELGLITIFTSTMGFIKPVRELTGNIQSLIQLYRAREHHLNPVVEEGYDEIAKLIMEEQAWPEPDEEQNLN